MIKIKLVPPKFWYRRGFISHLLLPFSWIYLLLASIRRFYYQRIVSSKLPVPVIVVGNINVGGVGKTPLVIFIVELLKKHGYRPGVISRGYGRKSKATILVDAACSAKEVGDEPLLIFRHTGGPVMVSPNKLKAAKMLCMEQNCNVIVSDDGLQHYNLPRSIEIAVIDPALRFGNGFCLPAGPLREPISRLKNVDYVVRNYGTSALPPQKTHDPNEYDMFLEIGVFRNIKNQAITKTAQDFVGLTVHAVAGIGNPKQFFDGLRSLGLDIKEHIFPDHHVFSSSDLNFGAEIVIMTEKDAVKCGTIAPADFWYMEVKAKLSSRFTDGLLSYLKRYSDFLE